MRLAKLRRMRVLVVDEWASPAALLEKIETTAPERVDIDAVALKAMLTQLAQANQRLEERKLVERAKGMLMKARGLDEESAYRALRRMAMDQNRRIGEVARSVISMARLLG